MAISSRELYLLDSLTTSPDPLGGRLETMDVFIGLSDPLDDAGPGLGFTVPADAAWCS